MVKKLKLDQILYRHNSREEILEDSFETLDILDNEYKKIDRSVNIKRPGYNLYLIDDYSKDRVDELKKYIEDKYKYLEAPKDICYVVLEDSKKPEVIFVSNGNGKRLNGVLEEIKNYYIDIIEEFYNVSVNSEKEVLLQEIQDRRDIYINDLMESANKENFDLKLTDKGFAFIPLIEDEVITEKNYEKLSDKKKDDISNKATKLKRKAELVIKKIRDIEDKSLVRLKEIYSDYINKEMEVYKDELLLQFIEDDNAYEYLEKLFFSIEKNIIDSYTIEFEEDEEVLYEILNKTRFHILVDNSLNIKPVVMFEEDPTINNLLGFIEYENNNGVYSTDLSLINAGSILKANNGCLIIRMSSLIANYNAYNQLKKVLISGKLNYESLKSYTDVINIGGLKPDTIPIDLKVILIGNKEIYDILYNNDEDFRKIFKLRAEFQQVVELNENSEKYIKKLTNKIITKNELMPITKDGFDEIIKYMSRFSGDRSKVSISLEELERILVLSNDTTKIRKSKVIESKDIIAVAYEVELIEDEYDKMYKENKILLSVKGSKVGVINGLAVIDTGYYSFGRPMRITCVAHKGNGKIIDIQKENKLSGKIHEKSISILKGLLNNMINPYKDLPVDFYLSFEQTYGYIDGDSASIAEAISILSALSKKAIKQNIGVTGSVNQLGEVQAIGGVNEKIEGFYRVCKFLDSDKDKGVLIPYSNINEIILTEEIEKSVSEDNFKIYVMKTLEDAIETLLLSEGETIFDFLEEVNTEIKKYQTLKKDK